jgi:hypothetical protein
MTGAFLVGELDLSGKVESGTVVMFLVILVLTSSK